MQFYFSFFAWTQIVILCFGVVLQRFWQGDYYWHSLRRKPTSEHTLNMIRTNAKFLHSQKCAFLLLSTKTSESPGFIFASSEMREGLREEISFCGGHR